MVISATTLKNGQSPNWVSCIFIGETRLIRFFEHLSLNLRPCLRAKVILRFWLSVLLFISTQAQGFSAYTNDELDQLERQFIQEINQSPSVIRDPLANEYINHLAKHLAEHGELTPPYFFIVKSNEINAFAGPGGYIGVNSQLILVSDSESELAGVMAHEMSHVKQHHLYRMLEHQKQMRVPMLASMLAAIALGVLNPALSTGALMGTLSGFAQDNINFVRSNEKEADSIGIDMLIKSGLDPHGMPEFFKKMQQSSRYMYTDNIPAILRTHPLDDERIAEAESRCNGLPKKEYPNQLSYQLFKEIIRNTMALDQKKSFEYYEHRCAEHANDQACKYGYALNLLNANNYAPALKLLTPLWKQDPNNLYYAIAVAHAEEGLSHAKQAENILGELYANFPDSYAVLMEYGDALIAANEAQKSAALLLKGSRIFKNDLHLCHQLARAQASSHQMGYAYFTLAECHILQGERHEALRKLKLAKTLAIKDHLLEARISAKMDDITAEQSSD